MQFISWIYRIYRIWFIIFIYRAIFITRIYRTCPEISERGYWVSDVLSIRHTFPARDTLKITVSISTPDRSLSFVRHEQARTKNLACVYNALISQLSYRADPIYQFARKSVGACVVQAIMFSFHSLGINQSREHDQLSAKDLAPFPSSFSVGAGTVSSSPLTLKNHLHQRIAREQLPLIFRRINVGEHVFSSSVVSNSRTACFSIPWSFVNARILLFRE